MSDGDYGATPDPPRSPAADDASLTRTRSPAPRPPWERFSPLSSPPDHAVGERPVPGTRQWSAPLPVHESADHAGDAEPTGCHTDGGLTVAELIARLGGVPAQRPRHHHAAPETEPPVDAPAWPLQTDDDHDLAPTYADELPDLGPVRSAAPRGRAAESEPEQTAVLPEATSRVPPRRIGAPATAEDADTRPQRGRRPMLLAARCIAAFMAVSALALTGGAWQWSASKNNRLNNVSALDPHSRDVVDPNAQHGDENFLIVGVDSRAGANSQMGAGNTEDAGGARSDTVMLVNIPASRKRVVAVSFPRDLAITPTRCEAWNPDTGAYGPLYDDKTRTWGPDMVYTETKLNSAYAFGGPKCLVKVIQKLSGLSINRFIAIDFAGFAKMVDALGGVEVCSKTPLKDYELGTVLAHAGRQVVDGQTALNYVRARQVTTEDNGDYGRIKRQQLFLSSLLRSLISNETFFSLSRLNNVVNMFISESYVDNVKTKDLVDLGQSVQGLTAGHITFVTVPTTGETDENGNEPPRTADMRALFDAIINDDPLPKENDQNATSTPTTRSTTSTAPQPNPATEVRAERVQAVTATPQEVTVQVSNSTGKTGLAATATNELRHYGFQVMAPDDYPASLKGTTVFFSPGNEQAAATVAATLPNSKVERITGIGQVVQVVLGPDFRAVSAPPPGGSSVSVEIDRGAGNPPTKLPDDLTVTNAADTSCK
ncbi:LytR family transcriptional regulator [Mycobacterium heckeshornense]|uniref:LCP family glycopolymer transferase n=1 Tax=Mycobacterium heckeshornense TaxID=110505 RepID=UPI0019458840|nr:LCP family protein [Mycobacterium heckeshornense]BCQ07243.1 LytR family transcriptional regulator [Mycobacterium heckeshornense]